MKTLFRLVIVALVLLAGYFGWTQYHGEGDAVVPQTATVTRGTVQETVLASGVIEASQLVSVGARTSGQIEQLVVSLGDEVAAGDLIAQIDDEDQQNDLLQAQADLANIEAQIAAKKANIKQAELTLARENSLHAQNYASQEDVEAAEATLEVYQAELDALNAQKSSADVTVSTAQIALNRTQITAPMAGTVVAVVVDEGQTVNASTDTPTIVKLANLDKMIVKAEISEADVVHVAPGQKVSFTILGEPDAPFEAIVRDVEPAPSEIEDSDTIDTDEAIYYNGRLEVDNPDHKLRIGMTTEVSIVLDEAVDVLTVPSSALTSGRGGRYMVEIYDAETGEVHPQPVEVGLNNKVTAEIKSGLEEGDVVVTGGTVTSAPTSSSERMRAPRGMF
ncbi:efflux RND transporter periplasmic adaptor subunit [Celeribacter halophilus]|uniref:Membrane fusion protein, macrolide-specific efflux system n=1 Tax=Celeribacter halophilus TaxID=576117 RepID=A0A1I3SYW3_9RHOB|nr:efflux RND transporter periplasmic adaptor subunit [Celeribacter halophilus]PZX12034.1 macrolide-specific efflux system membrane fusion protein [Celeribacter halophilus]SFJ63432.1 membrane fusion protein, macrolide-specific efflux system [Celeribacter halophilus]